MLFNFCFDYWMILLFSMSIFLCSKWYSIYKPCHLKCDSQISLFTNDGLSESRGKHYWKKRKIRKKTVPSLASTWHGNPLHSCEIDKPTTKWTTKNRISRKSGVFSDDENNSRGNSLHHFTCFINWLMRGNFV